MALLFGASACRGAESPIEFTERCGVDDWLRDVTDPRAVRRIVRASAMALEKPAPPFVAAAGESQAETAARAGSYYGIPPMQIDRVVHGAMMCEAALGNPQKLNNFTVPLIVGEFHGRIRPDIVARGHIGRADIDMRFDSGDSGFAFARDVSFARGDVIDLVVKDSHLLSSDTKIEHLVGKFEGKSPFMLQTKEARVTCSLIDRAAWEEKRKAAVALLDEDIAFIRALSPNTDATQAIRERRSPHLAQLDAYSQLDFHNPDPKRIEDETTVAVNEWWAKYLAQRETHHAAPGKPAGQWVMLNADFDVRTSGLACLKGGAVVPHCSLLLDVRVRRAGAPTCHAISRTEPFTHMETVSNDGATGSVFRDGAYRGETRITSMHVIDELRPGDILTLQLSPSNDMIDEKIDLETVTTIPFPIRAIRIGGLELDVY